MALRRRAQPLPLSGARMRRRWGSVGGALLIIVGGAAVLTAVTRTGRYLVRAAWEEGKILRKRRAIDAVVSDSATDAVLRGKLELVRDARRYAVDSLALPAKDAFTKFTKLESDTLVLVLSGAARDTLAPVTWWFPVVGRVPYKGFFRTDEAVREEERLRQSGYDTYLRPSPAFSTLGFFNDPVLSTTLRSDSADIANTVVHELTHNRYYAKGSAIFNESFANFVGARGAAAFFRARGDTVNALRCDQRWSDEKRLAKFWTRLKDSLQAAYAAHPGAAGKALRLSARDSVYAWARRQLVDSLGPQLTTFPPLWVQRVHLDNASLLARAVYMTDLQRFDDVWSAQQRDLRRTIDTLIAEHRSRR